MILFDRDGKPITLPQFVRLFAQPAYRCLAHTTISSLTNPHLAYEITTIWLGTNMRIGDGPPVIFETMASKRGNVVDSVRYCTESDARDGHGRIVESYAEAVGDALVRDVPILAEGGTLAFSTFPDEKLELASGEETEKPFIVPLSDVDKTLADIDSLPTTDDKN